MLPQSCNKVVKKFFQPSSACTRGETSSCTFITWTCKLIWIVLYFCKWLIDNLQGSNSKLSKAFRQNVGAPSQSPDHLKKVNLTDRLLYNIERLCRVLALADGLVVATISIKQLSDTNGETQKGNCASTLNIRYSRRRQKLYRDKIIFLFLYLFAQLGYYLLQTFVKPLSDRHSRHTQSPVPNQTHDTYRERNSFKDNWVNL